MAGVWHVYGGAGVVRTLAGFAHSTFLASPAYVRPAKARQVNARATRRLCRPIGVCGGAHAAVRPQSLAQPNYRHACVSGHDGACDLALTGCKPRSSAASVPAWCERVP
jgi:hypothetical protein